MKNLSKDSIIQSRKQIDDSSVMMSVYSRGEIGLGSGKGMGNSIL